VTFGKTKREAGLKWFEYFCPYEDRHRIPLTIAYPDICTHNHFAATRDNRLFKDTAPIVVPQDQRHGAQLLGVLNASSALLWLKQVCFSKRESHEAARDTYYEFAGGKVEQLPVPEPVAQALKGKSNPLSERLTDLSRESWERGRIMPSLALKKLFEKPGEAYHEWNSSLPGYEPPHAEIARPFASADELRSAFQRAIAAREKLRAEMVARQEEMDWLVYEAYGLIDHAETLTDEDDLRLQREQRPFCLWEQAEGEYDAAVALVPSGWSDAKRRLWRERLALIRDNEHVRRIERPVYKRRWDEQ